MQTLLNPDLLRRLEQMQLLAARRAKSSAKGERKSRARGQSVEFADYRAYVPGDDLRYLDWALFGRLDRLFIRLYEEERELPVVIFLDASESMTFGEPRKFDFARQLAAAVGYIALCGFDRVSIRVFPTIGEGGRPSLDATSPQGIARRALNSVRGKRSSLGFLSHLQALEAGGAGDMDAALKRGAREIKSTGAVLVISDFLDPLGYEAGLAALVARGFQVTAVQVLAPAELNPAIHGDLKLIDSETGAIQEVSFGKFRMSAYQRSVAGYIAQWEAFCKARGIRSLTVSSGTSLSDVVLRQMRSSRLVG
ncbi:MAG TPA: DUF58 domain-containing protein [Candidatus Limnocylindria bacterium]|nr:DUF58 domain-containing protein [Candidatus Limnocylindria bacterium]